MLGDSTFCFFKQKTAYEMRISDWSSDVCSSDLAAAAARRFHLEAEHGVQRPVAGRCYPGHQQQSDTDRRQWMGHRELDAAKRGCQRHLDRKSTRLNSSH